MIEEFSTLLEACDFIRVKSLQRHHIEYVLASDVWVVLPDYPTTEAEDQRNTELLKVHFINLVDVAEELAS
jgi:hypothetical protein